MAVDSSAAHGTAPVPGPWVGRDGQPPVVSDADRKACEALGGTVRQTGFIVQACTYPAPDAGALCSRGDECAGKCVVPDDTPAGTRLTGRCSDEVNRGGCVNFIVNGVATGLLCVD